MSNLNDCKYAKELIDHIESDKKTVLLFVSFDIAIIAITINFVFSSSSNVPFDICGKVILIISLLCLSLSAFCFFIGSELFTSRGLELLVTSILKAKKNSMRYINDIQNT
jgi:hypothetical protein